MYTYNDLLDDVNYLSRVNVETGSIGASEIGRLIPYIHMGRKNGKQIIISGGIHAREYVSSLLIIKQAYYLLDNFTELLKGIEGGIFFVPMLNPDGVMLCLKGLSSAPFKYHDFLKELNCGNDDFSLFKANINGVDLNTNFDANWGKGKSNVFSPSTQNFVGEKPFSECETQSIRNFTLRTGAAATVSYHALGQELYWEFGQGERERERDLRLARFLNEKLNYKLVNDDGTSCGGYKDYCIQTLKIPAFTIELVSEEYSHPLMDKKCIDDDFERNKDLPIRLLRKIADEGI